MVRGSNAKKINDSRLLRIQLPGNPCCIGLSGEFEKFRATFSCNEFVLMATIIPPVNSPITHRYHFRLCAEFKIKTWYRCFNVNAFLHLFAHYSNGCQWWLSSLVWTSLTFFNVKPSPANAFPSAHFSCYPKQLYLMVKNWRRICFCR